MNRLCIGLLLIAVVAFAQQPPAPVSTQDTSVLLAVVSRDASMVSGGIGQGLWAGRGSIYVEPMARLTQSGDWVDIPCGIDQESTSTGRKGCLKFVRDYLSKQHTYTVVSTDGEGAMVQAKPGTLSECFDYGETGTYSGAAIAKWGLAASSTELFSTSDSLRPLSVEDAAQIRKALTAFTPKKLDSVQYLRLFSLKLEGQELVVVQRAFTDYADKPEQNWLKQIFAIVVTEHGRFRFLHWKENIDDEEERVVGTIHMKNGRDFLITTVSDPESQWFRVYGIRDGKLALVYSGGGSAC